MKKNVELLYGFSCFDQFMVVIPLLVPYLATKGVGMAEFMELQAVFAIVIVIGEVPTGLLSDRWGRKRVLLLGSILKAVSFTLLPFWTGYEGFLFYHVTMGIALSMISGGDLALLYESHLSSGGDTSRGAAILGNAKLVGQIGAATSALLGGALAMLSFDYLLWTSAILGWIPVLLVLGISEPPCAVEKKDSRRMDLREVIAMVLKRDVVTRLVFLNLIVVGIAGLVMVWTNQKYWQESQVPLAWFGVLYAAYNLIGGVAGRFAASWSMHHGKALLGAAGVLPVIAYFGMASFLGWGGIAFGFLERASRGVGEVLFLNTLNERISSDIRATVLSLSSLGTRAGFGAIGPAVGFGIDGWGLLTVMSALGVVSAALFAALVLPLMGRGVAVQATR